MSSSKKHQNRQKPQGRHGNQPGIEKGLYTAEDVAQLDYQHDLGDPGEFPYTRGVYPNMYREKLWTIRQFSGFGTAEETHQRFKFLLEQGQSGLSVAFDLPTLMGVDSDNPLAHGEVGKCGVAVDSLRDMEILFGDIPLDKVTTSMTINAPAAILLAMYVVVAEKQGAKLSRIGGTIQNDILKEFIAQKEWIYPPGPSMRLVVDSVKFCSENLPRYNTISISGYHIREAGSTAIQELAFTLRNGIEYVEWCLRAGMAIDDFAPRLSFFFNSHNDFFEEIAKFRSARRLWAYQMRDRFKAQNPNSWMCRFHTQTAGSSLTAQQPSNNIVRTALQGLAAVLGGTNSLHTNALDEALALPTEDTARIALRTQQIMAHESGICDTADPLGGSYFLESLTDKMESGAHKYFEKIDKMGGMIPAIEKGYPQREIQDASYEYQKAIEKGEIVVVGTNRFAMNPQESEENFNVLQIGSDAQNHQIKRLSSLRRERNNRSVKKVLSELAGAAQTDDNLMPYFIEAVREYATLGEICDVLKDVLGTYEEPTI